MNCVQKFSRCELKPPKNEHSLLLVQFKDTVCVSMLTQQFSSIVKHLQLHQSFDVINPRCFPITVCGAKSLLHQLLLLPLDSHHPLLH